MPLSIFKQETVEYINYAPHCQNTGDLEAGTHTIVPTSRPAIGSAQYSKALTLPKPIDARLVVKQIASRLSVNIVGLGTATHVYLSVRVDVDDADHELFSEDWTSTGSKLDGVNKSSGVLFDLLKDGSTHTFYFLFWADVASQATIDLVQLWEAVGNYGSSAAEVLRINHDGFLSIQVYAERIGTGNITYQFMPKGWHASAGTAVNVLLLQEFGCVRMWSSVATDLSFLYFTRINLRSE